MEIKASCVNDKKAITALANIQLYKRWNPRKIFTLAVVHSGVIIAGLWALVAFSKFDKELFWPAVVFAVIYALIMLLFKIAPSTSYRNNRGRSDIVNQYTFTDFGMVVGSKGEGQASNTQIEYANIKKVYETSEYLFVYINKIAAFIVDRSTMSSEDCFALMEKLRVVLGKRKYIICKY